MSTRSRRISAYSDNSDTSSDDDGSTDMDTSVSSRSNKSNRSTSNESNRSTSTKSNRSTSNESNLSTSTKSSNSRNSDSSNTVKNTVFGSLFKNITRKKNPPRLYNLKMPTRSKNDIRILQEKGIIDKNKKEVSQNYTLIRNNGRKYPSKITEKQFLFIFKFLNRGGDPQSGFKNILMTPLTDGKVYSYDEMVVDPADFIINVDYYIENGVYLKLLYYFKDEESCFNNNKSCKHNLGGSKTRRRNKNKRKSKRRTNDKTKRK